MFQSKDYIYEIYRCGSFSAAARNLYITQPAISIAVKKEEQELGQPIFERSSSRLLLTDAGRAYIDAVEKLHRIEEDLKVYCNDLSNLKTGALRIGASSFSSPASFSRSLPNTAAAIPESLWTFRKRHLLNYKSVSRMRRSISLWIRWTSRVTPSTPSSSSRITFSSLSQVLQISLPLWE